MRVRTSLGGSVRDELIVIRGGRCLLFMVRPRALTSTAGLTLCINWSVRSAGTLSSRAFTRSH